MSLPRMRQSKSISVFQVPQGVHIFPWNNRAHLQVANPPCCVYVYVSREAHEREPVFYTYTPLYCVPAPALQIGEYAWGACWYPIRSIRPDLLTANPRSCRCSQRGVVISASRQGKSPKTPPGRRRRHSLAPEGQQATR
jgi:hypothetical protein